MFLQTTPKSATIKKIHLFNHVEVTQVAFVFVTWVNRQFPFHRRTIESGEVSQKQVQTLPDITVCM